MKRIFRRTLPFVLVLLLSFGLAACKPQPSDTRETYRLEVTVTEVTGQGVSGAAVNIAGLKASTDNYGNAVFDKVPVSDAALTVTADCFLPFSRNINKAEIAECDYEVKTAVTLTRQTPSVPEGYVPANEDYISFAVANSVNKAEYYWYAQYGTSALTFTVDIVDGDFFTDASDLGMNDNIEFVVQKNTLKVGWEKDASLDVMINPVTLEGWAKYAADDDTFGEDVSAALKEQGLLKVQGQNRTAEVDGYDGYTVTAELDYSLFSETDVTGEITFCPSARNSGGDGSSEWRSFVGYSCHWGRAHTAVRILRDGKFAENTFELPDLEALTAENVPMAGKSLDKDMAVLATNGYVRQYGAGANLFTDRDYLADDAGLPAALDGKSYIYASIEGNYSFTVEEEGYVAVAIPNGSAAPARYLEEQGFVLTASKLPRIGYNNHGTKGITEPTDYWVKWCEQGETFTAPKWCVVFFAEQAVYAQDCWVEQAAAVNVLDTPELLERFANSTRQWQGIPGIEAVPLEAGGTRLWSCWISGAAAEPRAGNYTLFCFSDDGGATWMKAFAVAFEQNAGDCRTFDPSLFYDGEGNLWLWWNQTNHTSGDRYVGIWCAKVSNPGVAVNGTGELSKFEVSSPRRIGDGLKMNKPTILTTGEWAFLSHSFARQGYTEMYVSADKGETWTKRGEIRVPNALFANETAFAETVRDGKTVYMAIDRTNVSYNLSVSYSYDLGANWTEGREWDIKGASSRPMLKTLASGNLIYIQHYNTTARKDLAVWLSTDGGITWPHCILLDERNGVSYPDVTQAFDGSIYIIWDRDRYGDKEILMTKITEDELLAAEGKIPLNASRRISVSTLNAAASGLKAQLSGIIYDENGGFVCGAEVKAGGLSVFTDENGCYLLDNMPVADYEIVVAAAGFSESRRKITIKNLVDSDNYRISADFVLSPIRTGSLSGTVLDFLGNPVEGAAVTLKDTQITAVTAADGTFVLNGFETGNYAVTVNIIGYKTAEAFVYTEDFTEENGYEAVLDDIKLLSDNTAVLGRIGGTNAYETDVFVTRGESGLRIFVASSDGADIAADMRLEFWINTYSFIKSRSANTLLITIGGDGSSAAAHFPSNKQTAVSSDEITVAVKGNYAEVTVPYAFIGQFAPEFYTVDKNTPVGVSMTSKKQNSSKFDVWNRSDMKGISGTDEVVRGNAKDYLIIGGDGTLGTELNDGGITLEVLDRLVADSAAYKENYAFGANMAQFEIPSGMSVAKVAEGAALFSDRDASKHGWDSFRPAALEGMSYLSKSISAAAAVTAKTSGYLLLFASSNRTPDAKWVKILDGASNPGMDVAHYGNYYAVWLEAGETVNVLADAILLTNAF